MNKLITRMGFRLIAKAGAVIVLGLGMQSMQVSAATTVPCSLTADTDADGFLDSVECTGFPLNNIGATVLGALQSDGKTPSMLPRAIRLDPSSKDLFVVYQPVATGSLLADITDPFAQITAYGLLFSGFSTLNLTAHTLPAAALIGSTRNFTNSSQQKAVAIYEDLDRTDVNILAFFRLQLGRHPP